MLDLKWAFESQLVKKYGAIPPENLDLKYALRLQKKEKDLSRAVAKGRKVHPYDCGPIAVIARYGFSVRCPGNVILERNVNILTEREFGDDYAAFGESIIKGDAWPNSDSGFIASWIAGSEYVKIQTGILIFFPKNSHLYQGPVPNSSLMDIHFQTMAGIEYGNPIRQCTINNILYNYSSLNIIVRLPPTGETLALKRGQEIAWFFPTFKASEFTLSILNPESIN